MEHRTLGGTGLDVSLLGFGGAEIGAAEVSQETVESLLNAALDAGLNVIDTAECYGGSEEKIGKAVAGRRDDFHLFTKCGHTSGLEGQDWEPDMLRRSIDRSLQRLQTDRVDLIQLHTCDVEKLRQGDVIEVLVRAREAGKTRFIGYSGDNENAAYAVECGAFDTLQTSVNLADQIGIDTWIRAAKEKNMGIIAKRPIANAAWRGKPAGQYGHEYVERFEGLDYPFLRGSDDVKTALRFTATIPGISTMIVGTNKPGRWADNAALLAEGRLSSEEYEAIRARWREIAPAEWVGKS